MIVAVDAGHGGIDPGATGAGGTRKKEVTLAIARALAARVICAGHARGADPGWGLFRATAQPDGARGGGPCRHVRLDPCRCDPRPGGLGRLGLILSERGASSRSGAVWRRENAADLKGGISLAEQSPDLRPLLLSLSQSASVGASGEAADRLLGALDGVGAVRKREVQPAAFVVLKSPDIPSLLVETAYISNPSEERLLRAPEQQQRLAGAIFDGIERYFEEHPPEGSPFAHRHERSGADEIARNDP